MKTHLDILQNCIKHKKNKNQLVKFNFLFIDNRNLKFDVNLYLLERNFKIFHTCNDLSYFVVI